MASLNASFPKNLFSENSIATSRVHRTTRNYLMALNGVGERQANSRKNRKICGLFDLGCPPRSLMVSSSTIMMLISSKSIIEVKFLNTLPNLLVYIYISRFTIYITCFGGHSRRGCTRRDSPFGWMSPTLLRVGLTALVNSVGERMLSQASLRY